MESQLIVDMKRYLAAVFAGTGMEPDVPPPASEEEIAAVEVEVGYAMPAQLKELYRFSRGAGSCFWGPIRILPERTTQVDESRVELNESADWRGPAGPTNVGPQETRTYEVGGVQAAIVVEVDSGDGSAGSVWELDVHMVDDPWSWLAPSLVRHVSDRVFLAERGWYEVDDRGDRSVWLRREGSEGDPRFLADLAKLGLHHLEVYTGT